MCLISEAITTVVILETMTQMYIDYLLKEHKTEKLHDMHVKELIQTNYFER